MADLDALLDQVPVLATRPRTVEPLPGGLTNLNLKVTVPGGTYVARCDRGDTELLGIDRGSVIHNTRAAEQAGAGAPFIEDRPDLGLLVIGFIEGRTLVDADLRAPGVLGRVAESCRVLHGGPRFVGDFDMFTRRETYLRICRDRGFAVPGRYEDFGGDLERVREALAVNAGPTVPCNNDLLAGNFVDDGEKIWLIDYDYSGNNDPFFELGNTWTECGLDDDHLAELVTAYIGRDSPASIARARLQATVSRYGWSLWGFIQAAVSEEGFDYAGWGAERFEAAADDFCSLRIAGWLHAAAGDGS